MRLKIFQKIIDILRGKITSLEMFVDKYEGLMRNEKIETFVIGSSHLASSFRAEKGEYNMALPSQDLYYSWHIYNKFSKPDVKNVIFSFSVFSPGHDQLKSPYAGFCITYKEVYGIPYREQHLADAKELYKLEDKYRKGIARYKAKQNLPEEYCGAGNAFKKCKYNKARRQLFAQKHWKYANYKPSQMKYFFKLLDATKEKGQNLYIIIPPATNDYKEVLPTTDVLFEQLYNAVKDYNHVRIFNYYDTDLFDDSDFLDGDPLNLKGGEKLTAMIRKDISAVSVE